MSRGPYSMLLLLAMSLPGAVRALGLGEIRVDSALNEPLSAQIDIVGASRDELAAITATVANHEIFQRYGADRPSFLSSATFKVGMDANGRPVLNIRSSEAFTDPLVSFLVDLRWGKNDVVREYSLLLDPPGYNSLARSSAVQVAAAPATTLSPTTVTYAAGTSAQAASSPAVAPEAAAPEDASSAAPKSASARTGRFRSRTQLARADRTRHRINSGETLRSIARRSGAHSETQIQRTMLAIFRANPDAFEGNINRMNSGAVLSIPSESEIEAITAVDAKREVRAQMTAWRLDGRPAKAHLAAASSAPTAPVAIAPLAAVAVAPPAPTTTTAPTAADAVLNGRVQTLEKELDDMHKQLASDSARIQDLKEVAARSETPAAPGEAQAPHTHAAATIPTTTNASKPVLASVGPQSSSGKLLLGPLAVTLGLLVAGVAYARRRLVRGSSESVAALDPLPGDLLDAPLATPSAKTDPTSSPAVRDTSFAEKAMPATATAAAKMAAPAVISQSLGAVDAALRPVAAPARRKDHPVADAPKIRWPAPTPEVPGSLEIDTELLERSYLESLGIDGTVDGRAAHAAAPSTDSTGIDTAVVDTSDLDTSTIDASNLDTAVMKASDLNTMVMDTEGLDDLAILEDTNKLSDTNRIDVAEINKTDLDYNLLDLDATSQHVHMPSDLHDKTEVKERRINIVDALKVAIERDPFRSDLRMKLLETYYNAAALNQRAFVEVVRKLAKDRGALSHDDWNRILTMGREIAAGDTLFADAAAKTAAA